MSRIDALLTINRYYLKREETSKRPIREYYCRDCRAWHVTSLSMQEYKERSRENDKQMALENLVVVSSKRKKSRKKKVKEYTDRQESKT